MVGFQNSMGLAFSLYGTNALPIRFYSLFDLLQHANNKIIWTRFFAFKLHPFVFNVFILLHHSLYIFTMQGAPYLQLQILLDSKKYNPHKSYCSKLSAELNLWSFFVIISCHGIYPLSLVLWLNSNNYFPLYF